MNHWRTEHPDFLQYPLSEQIHVVCDAFDIAWGGGQQPRIEDYLRDTDAVNRAPILQELLLVELEYLAKLGETPDSCEYAERFPEDKKTINRAFESASDHDTANISMDPIADTDVFGPAGSPNDFSATMAIENRHSPRPLSGQFGDYELLEEIARGGMGVVYKARQKKAKRVVALKMILSGQLAGEMEVKRFYTEAAAANLDHPNIVPIFDVGEQNGQHYFSMGFVDGCSLKDRLNEGPMPPREAARLVKTIAEAIAYAHENGVIHRDLKPANILLDRDDNPRVTDFGLAKQIDGDSDLTGTGQVMGTPSYMPPEQAAGKADEVGPRADIYSLGAILYCMLTGRPPFQSANTMDVLLQVLEKEPVPPQALNPGIPKDLETICLKCLQKDASSRYGTGEELAEELQRFLNGEPIKARRISLLTRGWRWCRRKPAIASLLVAVPLLMVLAVAVLTLWNAGQHAQELARLDKEFQLELESVEFRPEYLERMDALLFEMQQMDNSRARRQKDRLNAKLFDSIANQLRRTQLNEKSIDSLEVIIESYAKRDSNGAKKLGVQLQERLPDWRTIFEFDSVDKIDNDLFEFDVVRTKNNMLIKQPADNSAIVVRTTHVAEGEIEFVVTFADGWQETDHLGIRINDSESSYYELVLDAVPSQRHAVKESLTVSPTSFRTVRKSGGEIVLRLQRGNAVLISRSIGLPSRHLTLRLRREQGRLTAQAASNSAFTVRDPFPISSSKAGVFSLCWPDGAQISSMKGTRRFRSSVQHPLEHADELYGLGSFDAAMRLYDQEANISDVVDVRRECRYKMASCLLELDRTEEAIPILQDLLAEGKNDWALFGGCQLWLVYLDRAESDAANTILDLLETNYSFGELAGIIPDDIRGRLLKPYLQGTRQVSSLLRPDPQRVRNAQQAAAVSRLLSDDGIGNVLIQMEVVRAYRSIGDLQTAIGVAKSLVDETQNHNAAYQYARLLRQTGRIHDAITFTSEFVGNHDKAYFNPSLSIERARALAELENWEASERLVDQILENGEETLMRGESQTLMEALLLRGVLYDRKGDTEAAQQVWRKGLLAYQTQEIGGALGRTQVVGVMLAGLTRQATPNHVRGLMVGFGKATESPILQLGTSLVPEQTIVAVLNDMWHDARGKAAAQSLALQTVPLQQELLLPLVLAGHNYARRSAAPQGWTALQDEVAYAAMDSMIKQSVVTGELGSIQVGQLLIAWKGTKALLPGLGWDGLQENLQPHFRAQLAYVLAHRSHQRGNDQKAVDYLRQAAAYSGEDNTVAQLAKTDLDLLKEGNALVVVSATMSNDLTLIVKREGNVVTTISLGEQTNPVRLKPGAYEFFVESPQFDQPIRISKLSVSPGTRYPLTISNSVFTENSPSR